MENEKEIEITVAKHCEQLKQHDKDIEKLQDQYQLIYEMNTNIKLLVQQGTTTNKEITEIKDDISGMKIDINEVKTCDSKKDAQSWDKLKWLLIGAVLTAVVGIVRNSLGI